MNVLSFGDDAEEDEEDEPDAAAVRFRSAHETLQEDAMLKQASVGVHDEHVAQLQQRLAAEKVGGPSCQQCSSSAGMFQHERDIQRRVASYSIGAIALLLCSR